MKVRYWWQLFPLKFIFKIFHKSNENVTFSLIKIDSKEYQHKQSTGKWHSVSGKQGTACYSGAPGSELFMMHCHVLFREGILLNHCIPACLFGIYPPSLGIKSCPQGETGFFFADWCSGWGCGGSTKQSRSLCGWWDTKRKRRVKSTGTGSKMRLYWKTSFMGPGLQGG